MAVCWIVLCFILSHSRAHELAIKDEVYLLQVGQRMSMRTRKFNVALESSQRLHEELPAELPLQSPGSGLERPHAYGAEFPQQPHGDGSSYPSDPLMAQMQHVPRLSQGQAWRVQQTSSNAGLEHVQEQFSELKELNTKLAQLSQASSPASGHHQQAQMQHVPRLSQGQAWRVQQTSSNAGLEHVQEQFSELMELNTKLAQLSQASSPASGHHQQASAPASGHHQSLTEKAPVIEMQIRSRLFPSIPTPDAILNGKADLYPYVFLFLEVGFLLVVCCCSCAGYIADYDPDDSIDVPWYCDLCVDASQCCTSMLSSPPMCFCATVYLIILNVMWFAFAEKAFEEYMNQLLLYFFIICVALFLVAMILRWLSKKICQLPLVNAIASVGTDVKMLTTFTQAQYGKKFYAAVKKSKQFTDHQVNEVKDIMVKSMSYTTDTLDDVTDFFGITEASSDDDITLCGVTRNTKARVTQSNPEEDGDREAFRSGRRTKTKKSSAKADQPGASATRGRGCF